MNQPTLVAEISANHNGTLDRALRLIDAAKRAGADAVKIQTYRPEGITIDHDGPGFTVGAGQWKGRKLYDLYTEAMTPWEWHPKLFDHARAVGIELFSSPFDHAAVNLLASLDCPRYKIASFELVDVELIAHAAKRGKPMVRSTGMARDSEIADALAAASGARHVTLLHCISAYPAKPGEANLRRIPALRQRFNVPIGLSDHTLGSTTAIAATALGAAMIEKHLTLARDDGGPDAAFSLEPSEFRDMVAAVHDAAAAMRPIKPPEPYRDLRRSLYAVRDIAAGETLTEVNVRPIRPGHGLAPKHRAALLGKRAKAAIPRGTPMAFELVN